MPVTESANVSKLPAEILLSSDAPMIRKIDSEYARAGEGDMANRRREFENWGVYFAVGGTQYPEYMRAKFKNEKRNPDQFNIAGPKIDTLSGSLASEMFDLDWKPIDGVRNKLTDDIKATWYGDREVCYYEKHMSDVIRDGCIYRGIMRMRVTNKYNPMKNIVFERVTPGNVILDPHWVTDDDSDLERCWETFFLPAIKIREFYGINNPRIEAAIQYWRLNGGEFNDVESFDPDSMDRMQMKDHMFKVVEYHWMENVSTVRLVGQQLGNTRWITFPITKDRARLEQHMIKNKVDPMTIRETPYTDRIHHVSTICPSLTQTQFLENGVSEVQPKRLPYYIFSACRAFGKDKGVMDDIKDVQVNINLREMKRTDLINSATGGGKLVNKRLFSTQQDRSDFLARGNDPAYIGFVDGEELEKSRAIHYLNSNTFPSQIIEQEKMLWDIVDRISRVPAAMDAMSESMNESGILYARKMQTSRLGMLSLVSRVRNFRKKLGEGYYEQWPLTYSGPERKFATLDGRYSTVLNKRVYNDAEGRFYIQNRPDMIPRCAVIVTESKLSPNKMLRDRELYFELYKFSQQGNPEYANYFFHKIMETMETDESDKAELNQIKMMQKIRDYKKMMAEIANMDSTAKQAALVSLQATMQIEQMLGQPMPSQELQPDEGPEENVDENPAVPEYEVEEGSGGMTGQEPGMGAEQMTEAPQPAIAD